MPRAGTTIARVVALAVLVTLAAGSPAGAARTSIATTAPPRTTAAKPHDARILQCARSPRLEERRAEVGAAMQPVPGGAQMALRVDILQRRLAARRWTVRTDVPGLGVWVSPSDPTLGANPGDVYRFRQTVDRLVVPYEYRFRVGFRWLDQGGRVVREETMLTPRCRQPDVRPDLALARVTVVPAGSPGLVGYELLVRNLGRSTARGAIVAATLPGASAPLGTVRRLADLAPRQSATVTFVGPPCSAGAAPLAFVSDPRGAIEESVETNNQLAFTCPPQEQPAATLDER